MDLRDFRKELIEDAKAAAASDGGGTSAAFAAIVAQHLVDAEVLPDFVPAFYAGEGKQRRKLRVDGYALDDFDYTMNIIVASFVGNDEEKTLTRTEAEAMFEWSRRFVEETFHNGLQDRVEISTPAADLIDALLVNRERIRKYRFLLLSDGMISDRIETIALQDYEGVPVECQIWDVSRLYKVCLADRGRESIEINFNEQTPFGLPCLEAGSGGDDLYRCFLCVIPGTVLADVYDRYGGQLLEGNVRSFLSTKVAVNKKIRETILTVPTMFFAFNNGISATALDVVVENRPEGRFVTRVRDFQIINGGQTTASLSNARHRDKADLSNISVQMKLTEITTDQEQAHGTVQKIARSSNSQNKVSDADFFSTHPFHIRMEQISRRQFAPAAGGAQYNTHWFYERARGQYLQEQMRMTPAERKKFGTQNPKGQLITKTDLAKVRNSWRGVPHVVSKGAQANFTDFAQWVDEQWSASDESFNERFFQDSVALFLLFKYVEKLVTQQPWYQQGYRANIVTYSIALLAHLIKKQFPKQTLDLRVIWNRQEVPPVLTPQLEVITRAVMESLTDPKRDVLNVTQWCKRETCWTRVKALPVALNETIATVLIDTEDARSEGRMAKKDQKVVSGIEAQTEAVGRGSDYWMNLTRFAVQKKVGISPEETQALKIACQIPAKLPNPYQAQRLLSLAVRVTAEGFTG